jgi:NTE family protein
MQIRLVLLFVALILSGCATHEPVAPSAPVAVTAPPPPPPPPPPKPKLALALGGGAARGFAHIGVIKALEAQGIYPDIVVGTSAGAVVGALYAGGHSGFDLQSLAMRMDEGQVSDWSLPDRGIFKGEALQSFVNQAVANRPLEKLNRLFAVVATDLHSGEAVVFRTGNTGMAVRASSTVPGVFQPVAINGHEYVDGGLVSPVPVRTARSLGADFVIAVDISARPKLARTESTIDVLLQTFSIMGQSISRFELKEADEVIQLQSPVSSTDFSDRNLAILEGEKAAAAVMPELKAKLARLQPQAAGPTAAASAAVPAR